VKITQQLTALCPPIWYCFHKGFKRDGLVAREELALENSGIVIVKDEAALLAEVDDVFRTGKVFVRKPELLNSDALDLKVVGNLADDGLVHLDWETFSTTAVNVILVLLVQHFLFRLYI
jgi:hypothetical protein